MHPDFVTPKYRSPLDFAILSPNPANFKLTVAKLSPFEQTVDPAAAGPTPPEATSDEKLTQLAQGAADSATAIAHAVANLGVVGNANEQADIIWKETLKQIQRVQHLYNLPALPFANQPNSPASTTGA